MSASHIACFPEHGDLHIFATSIFRDLTECPNKCRIFIDRLARNRYVIPPLFCVGPESFPASYPSLFGDRMLRALKRLTFSMS
jgi:hypothetical protein